MLRSVLCSRAMAVLIVAVMVTVAATARAEADNAEFSLEAWADSALDHATETYRENGNLAELASASLSVFDTLIAWHAEPVRSPSLSRAFVMHQHAEALAGIDRQTASELGRWLLGLEDEETKPSARRGRKKAEGPHTGGGWLVAQAISSLRLPEFDRADGVYRVLGDLHEQRADHLEGFHELVAALVVVYDEGNPVCPIEQRVAEPVDAVGMFDHLAGNAGSLRMDPRRMPGELLVHVVNAPVSQRDLSWGAQHCGQDGQVGLHYHRVNYDDQGLQGGQESLKLDQTRDEFSLYSVLKNGGVCRHQAFYASSLGKSIGVPTVYMRADGMDMGHAWVGYLRTGSRGAYWDFNEGRYDEYQKVRGEVLCPQTDREISDQQVAMQAQVWSAPLADRLAGAASAAAARRIAALEKRRGSFPPPDPRPAPKPAADETDAEEADAGASPAKTGARRAFASRRSRSRGRAASAMRAEPREATTETRFELLQSSAASSPWGRHCWDLLASWSADLAPEERQAWFEAIHRFVGKQYPDVLVTTVSPMIATMDDPATRDEAWLWLGKRVSRFPQLALEVAVKRADSLAEAGELEAAWNAYGQAANFYATEGPFVIDALRGARRLMRNAPNRQSGDAYLVDLYGKVFRRVPKPSMTVAPQYMRGSTFARVGVEYAELLRRVGRRSDADHVLQQVTYEGR